MKTTIDLPEEILHRAKVIAAERRTTRKELVIAGLHHVLENQPHASIRGAAMDRLTRGVRPQGQPLTRNEIHARRS